MITQIVCKHLEKNVVMIFLLCILLLCLSGCSLFDGQKYDKAISLFQSGKYDEAITAFSAIEQYEDSSTFIMYIKTLQLAESGEYALAASTFETMGTFRDSKYLSVYYSARQAEKDQLYEDADALYRTVVTFRDSRTRLNEIPDLILERDFAIATNGLNDNSYDEADQTAFSALITQKYSDSDTRMLQDIYDLADGLLDEGNYDIAYALFNMLNKQAYSDSAIRMQDCHFAYVLVLMESQNYEDAYEHIQAFLPDYEPATDILSSLPDLILKNNFDDAAKGLYDGEYSDVDAQAFSVFVTQEYSDSDTRMFEEIYSHADTLLTAGEYEIAYELFTLLGEQKYSDSATRMQDCRFAYVKDLMKNQEYAKAYSYINAYLVDYVAADDVRKECAYSLAEESYANDQYAAAYAYYQEAGGYFDASEKVEKFESDYQAAEKLLSDGEYELAHIAFSALNDYSDSSTRVLESYYLYADELFANGEYEQAYYAFISLGNYRDSMQRSKETKIELIGWYIANSRFEDAMSLLNPMEECQEKHNLYMECQYNWAVNDFEKGDNKNAFYSFIILGDYKESKKYVSKLVANAASDIYELGMVYYNWGNYDIALKCFERIPEYEDVQVLLRYCEAMIDYRGVYKPEYESYEALVGNKLLHYDVINASFWSETVFCAEGQGGKLVLINEYNREDNSNYALNQSSGVLTVDQDGKKALGNYVYYDNEMVLWSETTYYTIEELNRKILQKNRSESEEVSEPYVGMTASEASQSAWGAPKEIERTIYSWGTAERWTCIGKRYGSAITSDRYIYFENGIVVGYKD